LRFAARSAPQERNLPPLFGIFPAQWRHAFLHQHIEVARRRELRAEPFELRLLTSATVIKRSSLAWNRAAQTSFRLQTSARADVIGKVAKSILPDGATEAGTVRRHAQAQDPHH
jgi:hypothetical protein